MFRDNGRVAFLARNDDNARAQLASELAKNPAKSIEKSRRTRLVATQTLLWSAVVE